MQQRWAGVHPDMVRFFFGHTWFSPVAFILQTMLVIACIWFPKTRDPGKEYASPRVKAARAFPMALFLVFGIIFVDIFVEVVLLGAYGYATWAQVFPSAILAGIVGVPYVAMVLLVSPNRKILATGTGYIASYIVFMKVVVPISQDIWLVAWGLVLMVGAMLVHLVLVLVEGLVKRFTPSFAGDGELWNVRERFKRVFSVRVNVILWALVVAEALCQAAGYSIITIVTVLVS